ncbi:hypothetical protein [Burkholderia ubonensis]|uniref:hypothetical protein n=1 Tax=Burkholderia ubonensis TaxID=101571 RepID=UPI0012F71DF5|nr:hypothetical protein [Burkholderia ubonensis]
MADLATASMPNQKSRRQEVPAVRNVCRGCRFSSAMPQASFMEFSTELFIRPVLIVLAEVLSTEQTELKIGDSSTNASQFEHAIDLAAINHLETIFQ